MQKHQQLQRVLNEIVYPNLEDRMRKGSGYISPLTPNEVDIITEFVSISDYTIESNDGNSHWCNYLPENAIILGYPISLELIIAALEKKEINYIINRDINSPKSLFIVVERKENIWFNYTPLQPLPQESVEKLLEIFKG